MHKGKGKRNELLKFLSLSSSRFLYSAPLINLRLRTEGFQKIEAEFCIQKSMLYPRFNFRLHSMAAAALLSIPLSTSTKASRALVVSGWNQSSTQKSKLAKSTNNSPVPKSYSNVHRWAQKQEENVKLLVRQVVNEYQRAMNTLIDHLYIPSDETVPFIQGNFAPVAEIGEKVRIELVEGEIPKDFPPGCYVRNGPNPRFGANQNLDSPLFGGKTLYSWFEGEGMLHATYFEEDGSIWYNNRYVETESFKLETKLGRTYLPTMDERSSPGARFNRLLNVVRFGHPQRDLCSTSIFEHAGHVIATAEGGRAFEIDISDLSTKGEYTCYGHWNRRFFGPHPKIHPETKQLVVYGFDIKKPYYILSVISDEFQGKKLLNKIDLDLDKLILMHDIGITERYIIVYDFPMVMDIPSMLLKGESIVTLDLQAESRIGVIPLTGNNRSVKWFNVDTTCLTHHANSYEDGDEIVVHGLVTCNLQLVAVPRDIDHLEWYSRGMTLEHQNNYKVKIANIDGKLFEHLHEWRLNLKTGEVTERNISQYKFPLEVPRINENFTGKKYKYVYAASEDIEASKAKGFPMYGKLVKIDVSQKNEDSKLVQFHDVADNTIYSEPVFVARPGSTEEDDGWIVTYVHNEATNISEMIIIDAQNFDEEPLARISLPQRVPYGFHGTYIKKKKKSIL
ncbi:hypothetical protein R1flu_026390 [Riccia fluitans]|uniref:Uncharacterized protein n=1 Tax=Riccia fluitans TaxID=41844 RepID=A0ABD1XFU8_9MARC